MQLASRTLTQWSIEICATCLMFFWGGICGAEPVERFEFLQIRMGIPVRIIVYAESQTTANQATQAAYNRIRELDRCLSDYDPDSELMQLCNTSEVGVWSPVSHDLLTVLQAAQQYARTSDGAFDVTVGPLTKLWRAARRRKEFPPADTLSTARSRVGHQYLEVDVQNSRVRFLREKMRLDLGGIAKGYAADAALLTLREHSCPRALIDAGGDIVAGDPPPGRQAWRIEVEKLRRNETQPPLLLELAHAAVATSGDAYQFVEIEGTRYSHLVDPQTGLGLTTPSSVTVVAPTGMEADSLASTVSVLEPQRGLELIETLPETEAFVIQLKAGERQTFQSTGFHWLP